MRKSSKEPPLPNFFIVGAAKSGTTSLAHYLGQHPDVFISPVKEPCYFVRDAGLADYDQYLSLFKRAGGARAIGEASTGYLYEECAPGWLHEHFPEAKVIIILRNPVDMAFSYWQYMQVIGNESKSFKEAISEKERAYRRTDNFKLSCVNWWASYLYLERALYSEQVKRHLDIFGTEKVRVYIFEEVFSDLPYYCKDIFEFLGVDPHFVPKFDVVNEGGQVRFQLLKNIRNRQYPILRNLLPLRHRERIRRFLLKINLSKNHKVRMNPQTRSRLEAFFQEDIGKLERLLSREIPQWKPEAR